MAWSDAARQAALIARRMHAQAKYSSRDALIRYSGVGTPDRKQLARDLTCHPVGQGDDHG